jgi:hypothetical protein
MESTVAGFEEEKSQGAPIEHDIRTFNLLLHHITEIHQKEGSLNTFTLELSDEQCQTLGLSIFKNLWNLKTSKTDSKKDLNEIEELRNLNKFLRIAYYGSENANQ